MTDVYWRSAHLCVTQKRADALCLSPGPAGCCTFNHTGQGLEDAGLSLLAGVLYYWSVFHNTPSFLEPSRVGMWCLLSSMVGDLWGSRYRLDQQVS